MEVEGETLQHAEAATRGTARADTVSQARATTLSNSHTEGYTKGTSLTLSEEASRTHTDTRSDTVSEGVTPSFSREESRGESQSVVPFISFLKREVTVDMQFLSEDEQMNLRAIGIQRLPDQHYYLQLAMLPTRAMREPDWIAPVLSTEERAGGMIDIHSRPTYATKEAIEAEEREQLQRMGTSKKARGSKQISEDSDASPRQQTRPNFWS